VLEYVGRLTFIRSEIVNIFNSTNPNKARIHTVSYFAIAASTDVSMLWLHKASFGAT